MFRLNDFRCENFSQFSQLYSTHFSRLSHMFCFCYHDSRRIFFLSKISIDFVFDFDINFSNLTRFRKSNAKIFFVKKTTKQIEHFFRRKTNIDIFDFDKQSFDIDKKYN